MNVTRNIYKYRVVRYEDDTYDLPLDVVYYIASTWNFRLNDYVYSHKAEIEQLLHEDIGGFFPYRLEIISPERFQEETINKGFCSLHPDWDYNVDFSTILSEKLENREKTYQAEALKRMMDKTPRFEESFVARIAPSADENTFGFYIIDVTLCIETIVPEILHDFICDLTKLNLTALSSKIDYLDDSVQEKVCYSENNRNNTYISFCGNDEKSYISQHSDIIPEIDPALRELAMRIKQEIDSYQRKNGVNTLLEKLGTDLIKSIEGMQLKPLSSLVIDPLYNIHLPEYNKKIEMHTLPKTIYVFFLRHPQGVVLKNLSDHRQELKQIYMTMTRQSITHEEAYQKIDGILDFTNGRLNQYICRISESFRKELSSDLAKKYAIEGQRNGIRHISLQPDKIKLPEQLKF